MRAWILLAGLALGGAGCGSSSTPACVSGGCTAIVCGGVDSCGSVCAPGSGCIPVTGTTRVEGGITWGAAAASTPGGHRVRGAVGGGSQHAVAGPDHRIEQGTLR